MVEEYGVKDADQVDYLVCGGCQKNFALANITNFVQHKKFDCDDQNTQQGRRSKILLCKTCPQKFGTPWSLLQHAQNVHALQIYLEQGDFSQVEYKTMCIGKDSSGYSPTVSVTEAEKKTSSAQFLLVQSSRGEKQIVQIEKKTLQSAQPSLIPSSNALSSAHKAVTVIDGCSQNSTQPHNVISVISDENKNPLSVSLNALTQSTVPISSQTSTEMRDHNVSQMARQVISIPVIASESNPMNTTRKPVIPATESLTSEKRLVTFVSQAIGKIFPTPVVLPVSTASKQVSTNVDKNQIVSSAPVSVSQSPAASMLSSNAETKTEQLLKEISAVQSSEIVENNEANQESETQDKPLCCDNQDCGVTVMPGTHEELKKCCSAIVPKKRKRHMATNHMPSMLKAKRKGDKYSVQVPSGKRPVIIDIQHHSDHDESPDLSPRPQLSGQPETKGADTGCAEEMSTQCKTKCFKTAVLGSDNSQERSVIIQPGSSISIPVSWESFKRMIDKPASETPIPVHFPGSASRMPISISVTPSGFEQSGEQNMKAEIKAESDKSIAFMVHEKDAMGRHKKRKYPTSRPFKCSECEQRFNQRIHLQKHQSKHTGIKPYQCAQCSYSTVEKSHLKVHIRVHTGEKPFKCTYCEYATAQNSTLKIHLRRHHGNDHTFDQSFNNQMFMDMENAESETPLPGASNTTHPSDAVIMSPWPCSICGENFESSSALQLHSQDQH